MNYYPKSRMIPAAIIACLMLMIATTAQAVMPPRKQVLSDIDTRVGVAAELKTPNPDALKAEKQLKERVYSVQVSRDKVTGAPRWIWSAQELLTGKNGEGKAVPRAALNAVPAGDPHRVVKAFVNEYKGLFGHGAEALSAARLKSDSVTRHNGLRTIIWQQEVDGIPVFEGQFKANISKNGELATVASSILPDAVGAANRAGADRKAVESNPPINAKEAMMIAARNIGEQCSQEEIAESDSPSGVEKKQHFSAAWLRQNAAVGLNWLPMDEQNIKLCWKVTFISLTRREAFSTLVDARTGDVLVRRNLTCYDAPMVGYHVFSSDSPSPFSPGWSSPSTSQPSLVSRSDIVLAYLDATASPEGWVNDDGYSIGNNANASGQGGTPRGYDVFYYPLDLAQSPDTYSLASATQLFYWINWLHDRFYQIGFDEISGNMQMDNFGRGGVGGDPVEAYAQDYMMENNAGTYCMPEGMSPFLDMGIMTGPTPYRDPSLDAEIIMHEYTHAVSTRIVGAGSGMSATQSQALGEGWSDFCALSFLSNPSSDNINGCYAASAYSAYQLSVYDNTLYTNYYHGIRRYPYSTDMTKSPLTFKDADPTQASSHPGISRSPLWDWLPSDECHNAGEIWCVTLWDARAGIIQRMGNGGNNVMLQLIIDGMKLGPANPNFLEARDAIIAMDALTNNGANKLALWRAFAKRGMGFSATSPASNTFTGLSEGYDTPPIHVSGFFGNDSYDGLDWAAPKATIQAGINAAVAGQEVWVSAGTYHERISVKLGIKMYGGFWGNETKRSQRNIVSYSPVIDGDAAGTVVAMPTGATSSTVLDGFTIRNGKAYYGGGIRCYSTTPTIANNTILHNAADISGGGIYCETASPTLINNVIGRNTAASYGGGVYCFDISSPVMTNNTIAYNTAGEGGGIYAWGDSYLNLTNNIVAYNSPGIYAEGIQLFRYNDVYGNTSYNYSGVPDQTGVSGNIRLEPYLYANGGSDDFHFSSNSPCIDTGTSAGAPSTDRDGKLRPRDGNGDGSALFDMGAYEY